MRQANICFGSGCTRIVASGSFDCAINNASRSLVKKLLNYHRNTETTQNRFYDAVHYHSPAAVNLSMIDDQKIELDSQIDLP